MYEQLEIVLAILAASVVLTLVEVIAYARLGPAYFGRIGRVYTPPRPLPRLPGEDALARLGTSDKIALRRAGGQLLARRRFGFGRRAGASARVELDAEGRPTIYWARYPTLAWIPITLAFGTFGGLTFGGGSWIVAAVFAGVFSLVAVANLRQSRVAFDEVVWPELARLLDAVSLGQ